MKQNYRGIDNPNNPQCRLKSVPRPYLYHIPQRLVQVMIAPAPKTKGVTGRRVGETQEQAVARRKEQHAKAVATA